MRKVFVFFSVFGFLWSSAQEIILSEAVHSHENNDKRLYRITSDSSAVYLGKIEINGFLQNEVELFDKFYKKAKIVGANTYIYKEKLNLDHKPVQSRHKEIHLYYMPTPTEGKNHFSVFNSTKEVKILINGQKLKMPPRTYLTQPIYIDTYIATRHFLGSRINLYYNKEQPKQNFQVISGRISSDKSGSTGGLVFKTGDIILLENSYADFLTLFYEKIQY